MTSTPRPEATPMKNDVSYPQPHSVLFVGAKASVFVTRTADALCQRGLRVQIIDPRERSQKGHSVAWLGPLGAAALRLFHTIKQLRKAEPYSVAVVHGLGPDTSWIIPLLKQRKRRTVGLAYGSDILRRKKSRDWAIAPALSSLDHISATNHNVLESLTESFPNIDKEKLSICRFGLPVIERMMAYNHDQDRISAKTLLGLNERKKVVSIGYSASAGQRQSDLIKLFTSHVQHLEHIQFIVPLQYGDIRTRDAVISLCSAENARHGREVFRPLTQFYDVHHSTILRYATDVLINNSVSDAFSGTVLEVLYSGNLIFAVENLPYHDMPGASSAISFYNNPTMLIELLGIQSINERASISKSNLSATRKGIESVASWNGVIPDWNDLLGFRIPSVAFTLDKE